jgi:REP element-mobilizing transposase RayT
LIEMDAERDHVHLLVREPPQGSRVKAVDRLKGAANRVLHKKRPSLHNARAKGVLWALSCFSPS